jgi:hypothetical protein
LLDAHPFATLAYSIRLLRAGHVTETVQSSNTTAGSYLVRLREGSSGATADVVPDENGELSMDSTVQNTSNSSDGQTLDTWVGSNNAYITTWYDQSGEGRHAVKTTAAEQPQIVNGGNMMTQNGKPGIDFDGTDDFMTVNTPPDPTDTDENITVGFWLRPVSDGSKNPLIEWRQGGFDAHIWQYSSETDFYFAPIGCGANNTDNTINLGEWGYYTVVIDKASNELRMYVNGTPVKRRSISSSCSADTASDVLHLGYRSDGDPVINGKLENITVYDRALSENTITRFYQRGRP